MKNIILLLCLVLFSSCNDNEIIKGINLDTGVSIYIKDSDNNNLINTIDFSFEDYRIYYLIKGVSTEVFNPNADEPRGFYINDETSPISMFLGLNHSKNEKFPITYIKWNNTDTDTLKAQFDRGKNYVICKKLWLNDELVWDVTTPDGITGREITIIK